MPNDTPTLLANASAGQLREAALQVRDLALGATLTDDHLRHAALLAELAEAVAELEERGLNLEVMSLPLADTGDYDCGWQLIEHYMAKPHRRVVAEFEKSAMAALAATRQTQGGGGA